ncbi:DUF7344 domain-containing protein [Natronobeatus ordinarius]|uniref:DUF7344 domain-containing protein n=1 Tax=Natronobeatus ordinarius TaxID=2963433 RepID=UPI0020CC6DFA|nr:hypothetical protein [Natronobeatus ordinarius]
MTSQTRTPKQADVESPETTPTRLFAAFAHERRQLALAYLAHRPAATALDDLAEFVALTEGDPTRDRCEHVYADLVHAHLPQLCDAGLARYDPDTDLVTLVVDRGVLTPYLELAGHASA